MSKAKPKRKHLALERETLRRLDAATLAGVNGGGDDPPAPTPPAKTWPYNSCPPGCWP